ncbi:hypothetical protein IG631_12786 [Alternaria alternata]|nr:hypothetical protein IG631_12786 [Alternaria alternata]
MALLQTAHRLFRDPPRFMITTNASTRIKYFQLLRGKGRGLLALPCNVSLLLFSHGPALFPVSLRF